MMDNYNDKNFIEKVGIATEKSIKRYFRETSIRRVVLFNSQIGYQKLILRNTLQKRLAK